jgi:phytoene synthase
MGDEALIAAIGRDRALSLELLVPQHRLAVETLWRIDAAMEDVVARSTEPTLGRIKLAWWREELQRLDSAPPPAEPRLQAVSAELLPRGISGAQLSEIEPGWATLLDDPIDPQLVADRGARLFTIIATLLGGTDENIGDAGAFWALVTAGKRHPELVTAGIPYADRLKGKRFPMWLRGLTLLPRLAAQDLKCGLPVEADPSRGRMMTTLGHIWSGIAVPH